MNVVKEKTETSTVVIPETTREITPEMTVKVVEETSELPTVEASDYSSEILTESPTEATTKITSNLPASTVNVVIERSDIFTAIPSWDTSVPTIQAETGPITLFHEMLFKLLS